MCVYVLGGECECASLSLHHESGDIEAMSFQAMKKDH